MIGAMTMFRASHRRIASVATLITVFIATFIANTTPLLILNILLCIIDGKKR